MSTPQTQDHTTPFTGFLQAVQFLTIFPVRLPDMDSSPNMTGALPWFPVIGAMIGGIAALTDWLIHPFFDISVRTALVLIILTLLTGLLHLDGFIDSCDGLLGTRATERRLEIMRDSRVGAYGVIGAVLLLLTQFAALNSLTATWRLVAIVFAPTIGRWAMVYAIHAFPYGRDQGAGSAFQKQQYTSTIFASLATVLIAVLLSFLVVFGTSIAMIFAIFAMTGIVAVSFTICWTQWAAHRLNGTLTGDTYGALNEIVVTAIWVALPIIIRYSHLLARS